MHSLGQVCSLEVPAAPRLMPPPTANPTMLEVRVLPDHTELFLCLLMMPYLCSTWPVHLGAPSIGPSNSFAFQAVLRVEGANIIPFTANNLNIFVTAVVTSLPNVTAKDIVISQVRIPAPAAPING